MYVTPKRTEIILAALRDDEKFEDVDWCKTYGEPGYGDADTKGVFLANWNNIPEWIAEYLQEADFGIEWSDEWMIDYDNNKAYRTSPDSYSWQSQIHFDCETGELLTPDDDVSDWVDSFINNSNIALPNRIQQCDIEELGYVMVNDEYANDFYGHNADPKSITEGLKLVHGDDIDVLFQMTNVAQFGIQFVVYYRPAE